MPLSSRVSRALGDYPSLIEERHHEDPLQRGVFLHRPKLAADGPRHLEGVGVPLLEHHEGDRGPRVGTDPESRLRRLVAHRPDVAQTDLGRDHLILQLLEASEARHRAQQQLAAAGPDMAARPW